MLHGFEPRCSPHIRRRRDRRIVLPRARVSSLSRASQPTLGQLLPDYGIKDFDIVVGWRFDRRWECVLLAATSISSSLLTYPYTSQAWMGRVKAAGFDLRQGLYDPFYNGKYHSLPVGRYFILLKLPSLATLLFPCVLCLTDDTT